MDAQLEVIADLLKRATEMLMEKKEAEGEGEPDGDEGSMKVEIETEGPDSELPEQKEHEGYDDDMESLKSFMEEPMKRQPPKVGAAMGGGGAMKPMLKKMVK